MEESETRLTCIAQKLVSEMGSAFFKRPWKYLKAGIDTVSAMAHNMIADTVSKYGNIKLK